MLNENFAYEVLDSLNGDVLVLQKKLELLISLNQLEGMQRIKKLLTEIEKLPQQINDCLFIQPIK